MDYIVKTVNSMTWVDSSLLGITIDHDIVSVNILPDWGSGWEIIKKVILVCKGFASIKYVGQWDENFITSIKTTESTEFIRETVETIKKNDNIFEEYNANDPYWKNINGPWVQLPIKLIDGVEILIVCQSIEIVQET